MAEYKVWVFIMSCCISSAVCCVLITSSMSGVALGYNYSLSEYIDTKETNVSVFIKRGVFDDDVVNEMVDWRRKGDAKLPNSFIEDNTVKTEKEEIDPDRIPAESARRLDDSIVQSSNENNNFEGALMRLTVKPPFPLSTTAEAITDDSVMEPVRASYPPGSLDQLKAIQAIINARKAAAARNPLEKDARRSMYGHDGDVNPYTSYGGLEQGRRMLSEGLHLADRSRGDQLPSINPARFAVPSVLSQANWEIPKMQLENFRKVDDLRPLPDPIPKPVTYRTGPIRPSTERPEYVERRRLFSTVASQKEAKAEQPIPGKPILEKNIVEDKLRHEERFDERSGSEDDIKKDLFNKLAGPKIVGKENNEYYDEDLKGLPVRRRRSINNGRAKLKTQEKHQEGISHKVNSGHLSKFKVGKTISNEITDYPSILVRKLHFLLNNALPNGTTSTNEKEVKNGNKAVEVTVNDPLPITDTAIRVVSNIIQSMFS